jgi:NDP-sugar pyrophosphorylase family protein
MQCVVLAGGLATRLRPLTDTMPKALIPVAGKPFAAHQLAWLASNGVSDVVYSIGHRGEEIREFVGDGEPWALRVRYADEGDELRGTAGALRVAHEQGLLASDFGVVYGDSYLDVRLADVQAAFEAARPAAMMTVYRNDGVYDESNAAVDDGRVVRYEKGLSDPAGAGMYHIDYGFSMIDRDAVMPLITSGEVVDLASIFGRLSAEGRLGAFEVSERFYEIGSHAGLAELEAMLTGRRGDRK